MTVNSSLILDKNCKAKIAKKQTIIFVKYCVNNLYAELVSEANVFCYILKKTIPVPVKTTQSVNNER